MNLKYAIFKSVIVIAIIYLFAHGIWMKVVDQNEDDYLDNDRASLEMVNYGGSQNTLEYDIMTCNYKGVQEHLAKGEEVNGMLKYSKLSPIMLAATLPNDKDAIKISKILLKYGANVQQKDQYGANVLFYTIYYGDKSEEGMVEVLDYYIKKGADVNFDIYVDENYELTRKKARSISLIDYCKEKELMKVQKFLKGIAQEVR